MAIGTLLLIVALILFILAAIGIAARFNLVAAGLACLTLAALLGATGVLR